MSDLDDLYYPDSPSAGDDADDAGYHGDIAMSSPMAVSDTEEIEETGCRLVASDDGILDLEINPLAEEEEEEEEEELEAHRFASPPREEEEEEEEVELDAHRFAASPLPQEEEEEPEVCSLTVAEFVAHAKQLLRDDDMASFSKFVLTGLHRDVQYQVDPIKNALQNDEEITALRDYDSVLGIHDDICVTTALTVYPVSKFEDTLQRNIHIKISFTNPFGEFSNVPVHRIPNLCIAKWGTRNMIRVLLPGLYNGERRSSFLTQEELAIFYEKGLRPAAVQLAGPSASEWPPSYSAEMFRARGKNGTLSFQTKSLPDWRVRELGDSIRQSLTANGIQWGRGMQFLHQIRGIKSSNGHSVTVEAAQQAWEDLFEQNNLDDDALITGDWWVDVGLELASEDGQCLAWRTDSHFHVVKDVLQIPDRTAERITRPGSSKYIRDLTSHLTAVSGCRISPGVRAEGPYKAKYLQMYPTDKAITYRQDGRHFGKFMRGEDIIRGKADNYCHDLYELYREATDKNPANARIEVRIPVLFASEALIKIEVRNFRNGLVSFDPVVWWSLRAYRVLAFKHILEQQDRGAASVRGSDAALLLTAAAPWFLNGLHSAPDNGSCARDLMGKILPLINRVNADVQTLAYPASTRLVVRPAPREDDRDLNSDVSDGERNVQEDNLSVHSDLSDSEAPVRQNRQLAHRSNRPETLPYNPFGIVFLREIRMGGDAVVPRFRDTTVGMITPKTFRYIFNIGKDDIETEFFKARRVIPPNPHRVSNKTRTTAVRIVPTEDEPQRIFNLAARGYRLPPRQQDAGSDIGDVVELTDSEDGDDPAENVDIDQKLTELWRQFLVDVTAKVPNRKGAFAPSYCVLSKEQRDNVNEATYRNLNLANYFNDCQYSSATTADWESAFNKCWPQKGKFLCTKTQNFGNMKYYIAWDTLINHGQPVPVEEMRAALRKRFFKLKWFPYCLSDRLWATKPDATLKRFPGADPAGPAPRVVIRWNEDAVFA